MKFPVVFHIGSFDIPIHIILEAFAFFAGFRYFLFLRKKQGDSFSAGNRIWIIIGAIFGALVGSRVIGALEQPNELFSSRNVIEYIYNNKTVVGGFLGGLFGVEAIKKLIDEKNASGDLFVYPIILGLIIGRFGCFSMGVYEETYGILTSAPWGMDLGDGFSRHPVTLYEIIFLVILWICLKRTEKKFELQKGAVFKLFMIAYLLFRFLLEFIKPHFTFLGLSTIQLTCLAGLLYYLPYIMQPRKLITAYA